MLDVHAPHHALHAWRDFFVHLATISLGLLIALGLEATVEWLHHRHQVAETREALQHEREQNHKQFAADTDGFWLDAAVLQNNLLVLDFLREHPGAKPSQLPGVPIWSVSYKGMEDSAWKAANQTGVVAYMPQDEVVRNEELYKLFALFESIHGEELDLLFQLRSYSLQKPDPTHLTAAEIDDEIKLTHQLLSKVIGRGYTLLYIAEGYQDFTHAPSREQLNQLVHLSDLYSRPDYKAALSLTEKRVEMAVKSESSESVPSH